jgi:hypothetical protein
MVYEHSVYTSDPLVSEKHLYQTVTVKSKRVQDALLHAATCSVWCTLCAGGSVESVLLQNSVTVDVRVTSGETLYGGSSVATGCQDCEYYRGLLEEKFSLI